MLTRQQKKDKTLELLILAEEYLLEVVRHVTQTGSAIDLSKARSEVVDAILDNLEEGN